MSWRMLGLTVMIAVMLAAYSTLTRRAGDGVTEQAAPAQPGYYLRDAIVTETDATGAPKLKLHAQEILQNPRDNSVQLQQVALDYQSAPDTTWLLTAKQGYLPAESRTIRFSGAVQITPQQPADNHIILRTEVLSIDTTNNIATAPGHVDMEMDRQRLSATGLKYDLKRQTLQLESRLHGLLQPQ